MPNLLVWIIVGGIAGWLASVVVRGTGLGIIGDIIVGIIGAVLGSFLLTLVLPGSFTFTGLSVGSVVIAFIGAVIPLFIVRFLRGRTASARR
jgi:uncharacterized membrane protein YeaQ/YmgE (transglycosylase-associated protein family)